MPAAAGDRELVSVGLECQHYEVTVVGMAPQQRECAQSP